MSGFFHFMQSTVGRWVRVIVGMAIVVVGLTAIQGIWGSVVAAIGLLPVFAGLARVCLIAPLFGYTFNGTKRTDAIGS